jgi:3-isopropylmalate/(R)-2-methylmalate dehydratase large subunit
VTPGPTIAFPGRLLFLTQDLDLLSAQLDGKVVDFDPERLPPLLANVSTDEIAPSWACYYYDDTLGRYCLAGLRGGRVGPDAVKNGGFSVIVSGPSKGCGSSRETAPYSELAAGVRLVIAPSIEKIYRQNAQNIGLLTSTDMGLVTRILRRESIPIAEFARGLDPISAAIVEHGGLFAYSVARIAGRVAHPLPATPARSMTIAEKILASHAVADANAAATGAVAVRPGDALFARVDVRFSHEYVTPMAEALFRRGFGAEERVSQPEAVYAFRDHLTLLDRVMPEAHKKMGLDVQARKLASVQDDFATRMGVRLYGEVQRDGQAAGSEAICHNLVIEEIALPGQVVVGTDSHTCMAGALGCFAFGVGASDMANAWKTRDVRVTVPETVRFVLEGRARPDVCAKDVMLHLLSQPFFKSGEGIGKVIEFAGSGVGSMPLDERATLTNMAVEAGGFTGIVEADEVVVEYLAERRGLEPGAVRARIVRSDPGARYCATFSILLESIGPMVATPGDPRNGIPLASLAGPVKIDIAYGGSCTGGKRTDMDMYARVLAAAAARGQRVADGVRFYIQFGSQNIRRYAEDRGYVRLFESVGVELVDPSCGACIKAGPGASDSSNQVTVSAQNRNFPGRSGPGSVYLASPLVVAASALTGTIAAPVD